MVEGIKKQVKLFLKDSYLSSIQSRITALYPISDKNNEKAFTSLVFEETIFHPQGGGQPADSGHIEFEDYKIPVSQLQVDRDKDLVLHLIENNQEGLNKLKIGDQVKLVIDIEKRMLNARLHSAGHLLDISTRALGLDLIPGKGYHFPDGSYVEYAGSIEKEKVNEISEKLTKISNDLISGTPNEEKVISQIYSYEEGKSKFKDLLPDYLKEGQEFRWVQLTNGDKGCPCGGTHVKHIKDIGQIKITKISNKKQCVRIAYKLI